MFNYKKKNVTKKSQKVLENGPNKIGVPKVVNRRQKTGERYLPKKAREALSPQEYAATTKAKREGTRKGRQQRSNNQKK